MTRVILAGEMGERDRQKQNMFPVGGWKGGRGVFKNNTLLLEIPLHTHTSPEVVHCGYVLG